MPDRPDAPTTRALAWLYAPAAQRPPLALLCALEREIGASLRPGLDHQVAHARLNWWREECARLRQGRPAHPLTRELAALRSPSGPAPLSELGGLVDTAVWDLASATFETRGELTGYCERWSAAVIEMELLLALAPDARQGRLRLPLDELERVHATPASVAQPPWPAELSRLVGDRHRELRAAIAASVNALARDTQAAVRGLIVWAAIACAQSVRAQALLPRASFVRDHHAPLDGWRAWRAARRAAAGRGMARAA